MNDGKNDTNSECNNCIEVCHHQGENKEKNRGNRTANEIGKMKKIIKLKNEHSYGRGEGQKKVKYF